MKKHYTLFLILFAMFLAGCSNEASPISTDQSVTEEKEIHYTVYYSDESTLRKDMLDSIEDSKPNASFVDAATKRFTWTDQASPKHSSTKDTRSFSLRGTTVNLDYQKSRCTPLADCDVIALQTYAAYDQYSYTNVGAVIDAHYRQETGELLYYLDSIAYGKTGGDFTKEQATQYAADDLLSIWGAPIASRYSYQGTTETETHITVIYEYKIHSYQTLDQIILIYNRQGQLALISAEYCGMFEVVKDGITKERLQAAEAVLTESILEEIELGTTMLVLDAQGDVYLKIVGYRTSPNNSFSAPCEFYINVN